VVSDAKLKLPREGHNIQAKLPPKMVFNQMNLARDSLQSEQDNNPPRFMN